MVTGEIPGIAQDAQQGVDLGAVPGRVGHYGIGRDVTGLSPGMRLASALANQLPGHIQG